MDLIELIKKDIENNFINENSTFNKNIQKDNLSLKDYMKEFDNLKN